MPKTRREFSPEVQAEDGCSAGKQRATANAGGDRGQNIAIDVTRSAGDDPWRHGAVKGSDARALPLPSLADQASEIAWLMGKLDRTRMKRDVLKKAIGIFAEVPG